MKKALLVISFGTSYEIAMKAIENIEEKLKDAFPEYDFNRAFTSGMIIKKLLRTKNQKIETTTEALERLYQEGYEEVLCQPTHIINGIEYDKMCKMIAEYQDKFKKLRIGAPLLTESEDFEECAKRVMENMPNIQEGEALVFMGHGTDHFANGAYSQIENTLRHIGYENVYVGTVEGFPDLSYVEKRLEKKGVKKVYLAPLMIVAGDHARNDLAGEDEDSWKSILEAAGYEVEVKLQGIGEYDSIAELFVEHAKECERKGKTMAGKLYGIGVGPGDPELLTLKAKRLIEEADIVAVPVKKLGEDSVALHIAKQAVHIPEEKIVEIEFTMNKDKTKREACRREAAKKVTDILDEGKNIAMLALGDIGIYSTYAYVHRMLIKDGYEVLMISGIPSFCAGASAANISLVEGNEGFGVIPSLRGIEDVKRALDVFDNLVIMKVGNHVQEVYDLLKERGMEKNAVIVSNCGMEDEYIGELIPDRKYGYFTTMIVKKEL